MIVGSSFATASTDYQPMKIAAAEALWNTEEPAAFSLFQIGGFSKDDQTPSFDIEVPHLLSILATGTWSGKVDGLNQLQQQDESTYGPGNYMPPVEPAYWGMRVMAYLGGLMVLVALAGAWLYRTKRLERARWFLWTAVVATAFPFIAAMAGWILTEMGRQPWIVQGLLKTADANSPNVSSTTLGISLGVFFALYGTLAVVDVVLMRRFARLDPPSALPSDEPPVPAMSF
jgi:cytochrome d ubiquinol oxidase subunit I